MARETPRLRCGSAWQSRRQVYEVFGLKLDFTCCIVCSGFVLCVPKGGGGTAALRQHPAESPTSHASVAVSCSDHERMEIIHCANMPCFVPGCSTTYSISILMLRVATSTVLNHKPFATLTRLQAAAQKATLLSKIGQYDSARMQLREGPMKSLRMDMAYGQEMYR